MLTESTMGEAFAGANYRKSPEAFSAVDTLFLVALKSALIQDGDSLNDVLTATYEKLLLLNLPNSSALTILPRLSKIQ